MNKAGNAQAPSFRCRLEGPARRFSRRSRVLRRRIGGAKPARSRSEQPVEIALLFQGV
jgi:hypothetical protein